MNILYTNIETSSKFICGDYNMPYHVQAWGPINIDAMGNALPGKAGTIAQVMTSDTELRVWLNSANTNTNGYPDLQTYLDREEADSYVLVHLDQSFIITRNPA